MRIPSAAAVKLTRDAEAFGMSGLMNPNFVQAVIGAPIRSRCEICSSQRGGSSLGH